jgi:hypothetical protein
MPTVPGGVPQLVRGRTRAGAQGRSEGQIQTLDTGGGGSLSEAVRGAVRASRQRHEPDDLAVIVYTSGTTPVEGRHADPS